MKSIPNTFGLIAGVAIVTGIIASLNAPAAFIKPILFFLFCAYIAAVILSVQQQAKTAQGEWQILFGTGFRTVLVAVIFTIISLFIGIRIFPSYKQKQIESFKTELVKGNIGEEKMKEQIDSMESHFTSIKIGQITFMLLPPGLLFAAIAAFGFRNKFVKNKTIASTK